MKFVLQRVLKSKVTVDKKVVGEIGKGYLVLVGIKDGDNKEIADKMIEKVSRLRIFQDSNQKTNLDISQADGEIMIVSQFTLYADVRKGNRPSFTNAAAPTLANELYEYIIIRSKELFKNVESGIFGADMEVSLVNDGPFTIVLDSEEILR